MDNKKVGPSRGGRFNRRQEEQLNEPCSNTSPSPYVRLIESRCHPAREIARRPLLVLISETQTVIVAGKAKR
jgi:hypothetical protein